MYCEKCGDVLKEGQLFCPKCGTKIDSSYFDEESSDVIKQPKKFDRTSEKIEVNEKNKCSKCGAENPPEIEICFNCGKLLTSNKSENINQKKYHPYQELGGFLAFQVYGGIIGSIALMVFLVIDLVNTIKLLSLFGVGGFPRVILLIAIIFEIICSILIIRFLLMIKNKNQNFLSFYHKLYIALLIILLISEWVVYGFGRAILYVVLYSLVCFVWTLYFVKSVRVRTYMGTDEYLKNDYFTRNVPSPRPADE